MASASSCSAARTTSSTEAVVAQMDHFRALRLDDAAHDIDGGIVAVEQAGGRDKTQGDWCLPARRWQGRAWRGNSWGLRQRVCYLAILVGLVVKRVRGTGGAMRSAFFVVPAKAGT